MTNETLATPGQTDTAPAVADNPAGIAAGTAPEAPSQQQPVAQAAPAATDAPAAPAAKPDDKPTAKAPEQYADFTLPEGVNPEVLDLDGFKSLAKDLDLDQAGAQKLVDAHIARESKTRDEWIAAVQTDKEFGGAKLVENLAVAKRAFDAYGTPELKQLLNKTGMGNNPEFIRAFYRAGKAISEDQVVTGGATNAPKSRAEVLFPNQSA